MNNIKTIKVDNFVFDVNVPSDRPFYLDWLNNFWDNVQDRSWKPDIYKIFNRFLNKEYSYVDIGPWIGPTIIPAARLAKHCYGLEPDSTAFEELTNNINLNQIKNISVENKAINIYKGSTKIGNMYDTDGNSASSLLFADRAPKDIECLTLTNFFTDHIIRDCNFIKLDTYGFEVEIIDYQTNFFKSFDHILYVNLYPHLYKKYYYLKGTLQVLKKIYPYLYIDTGEPVDIDFCTNKYNNTPFSVVCSKNQLSELW